MTARGASNPVEPIGSLPVETMGSITRTTSSDVYPNSARLRFRSGKARPTCLPEDSASSSRRFFSSQSRYGYAEARASLISWSRRILPAFVSTMIILPGLRRPVSTTSSGRMGMTPASEARIIMPSAVTEYLAGRSPFLSSMPPARVPSVNMTAAGPSQGSISMEWYS